MNWFAVSLVFSLVALFGSATADQRDVRLVKLFERLHRSEDSPEVVHLQSGIWSIWTESADEESNALMYDGLLAMRGKRHEVALKFFDALVKHDPDFAEGWNKRATVLYLLGRYERSIADIKQVLALEKRHFGALSGLGLCYEALGDEAAAVKAYQLALEANPHLHSLPAKIERLRKAIQRKNI